MPRWLEVVLAVALLVLLAPVLALVAALIRWSSRGPVLYRQQRVGRGGTTFTLLKFRTMRVGADREGQLSVGATDPRTTAVGRRLRQHKLDELPQLVNVVRGEMSFVGPRPEVPEYVDPTRPEQAEVLRHRPGLTDPASLAFRCEGELLAGHPDPERYYVEVVLPAKLRLSAAYLRRRSLLGDLRIVLQTAGALRGGAVASPAEHLGSEPT
ncbi:sugar transferase [Egicoccus sp. AB-alg2]|uniref:sugar transferase n=1 Tax=Egicoccus sp. AB-alg2 TaxID=3242693 RepID=UPI00359EBDC5